MKWRRCLIPADGLYEWARLGSKEKQPYNSTRQVGRIVAIVIGEVVSPQTVSPLTRGLDESVQESHQALPEDEGPYLCLDGVSLRVRRTTTDVYMQEMPGGVRATVRAICAELMALPNHEKR